MHLSGVQVPPLGSPQDRLFRAFLTKRAVKEVYKHKIFALSAVATAGMLKDSSGMAKAILDAFDNYSNMEHYLENVKAEYEISMKDEYEFWKNSRPKVNISKDGKASLSLSTLIPKQQK